MPTGFLSDENGVNIATPDSVDSFFFTGPGIRYQLIFDKATVDGLIHHDIHFEINLPKAVGTVTSGELKLFLSAPPDPGEVVVGVWVPEPSTLTLLALGTLGLLGYGWRRRKQVA